MWKRASDLIDGSRQALASKESTPFTGKCSVCFFLDPAADPVQRLLLLGSLPPVLTGAPHPRTPSSSNNEHAGFTEHPYVPYVFLLTHPVPTAALFVSPETESPKLSFYRLRKLIAIQRCSHATLLI